MQRMKNIKFHVLIIFLICPLFAKDIYFTRSGTISFYSSAILEDIKAINDQVTCVLDLETFDVAFRVPIRGFTFDNSMMQEHFNENYLESEKFPNAAFKGKIDGFNSIQLSQDPQEVTLNGTLTIHGISQKIQEKGTIAILDGFIQGNAQFHIIVADYGIVVPKIVRNNIAKTMDITVSLNLKEK